MRKLGGDSGARKGGDEPDGHFGRKWVPLLAALAVGISGCQAAALSPSATPAPSATAAASPSPYPSPSPTPDNYSEFVSELDALIPSAPIDRDKLDADSERSEQDVRAFLSLPEAQKWSPFLSWLASSYSFQKLDHASLPCGMEGIDVVSAQYLPGDVRQFACGAPLQSEMDELAASLDGSAEAAELPLAYFADSAVKGVFGGKDGGDGGFVQMELFDEPFYFLTCSDAAGKRVLERGYLYDRLPEAEQDALNGGVLFPLSHPAAGEIAAIAADRGFSCYINVPAGFTRAGGPDRIFYVEYDDPSYAYSVFGTAVHERAHWAVRASYDGPLYEEATVLAETEALALFRETHPEAPLDPQPLVFDGNTYLFEPGKGYALDVSEGDDASGIEIAPLIRLRNCSISRGEDFSAFLGRLAGASDLAAAADSCPP